MTVMELTSFYDTVFYSSSLGESEEPPYPYSPNPAYQPPPQFSPAFSCSPSSLSPETSSTSSVSPQSELPYQPASVSACQYGQSKASRTPKIPPLEVLQQRRLAANARERKRANKINFAFNRLRRVLPGFSDREISKFEAIQLARNYIAQLTAVLQEDESLSMTGGEREDKQ